MLLLTASALRLLRSSLHSIWSTGYNTSVYLAYIDTWNPLQEYAVYRTCNGPGYMEVSLCGGNINPPAQGQHISLSTKDMSDQSINVRSLIYNECNINTICTLYAPSNCKLNSSLTFTLLPLLPSTHTLNLPNPRTHHTKNLAEPKAPTLNPHAPNKEIHQRPIANTERQEDAEIAPLVLRLDVDGRQIVVANGVRTVLAV